MYNVLVSVWVLLLTIEEALDWARLNKRSKLDKDVDFLFLGLLVFMYVMYYVHNEVPILFASRIKVTY